MHRYLYILLILLSGTALFAQKQKSNGVDSLYVKGRSHLVLRDTIIYVRNDTLLLLPADVVAKIKRDQQERSTEFYNNLKEKFYRHRLTKELYDLLFDDPPETRPRRPTPNTNPNDRFEEYDGRHINRIIIKKLDPFGTRVTDTTRMPKDWFSRAGNTIHVSTRERVIRNNLFFEEGDYVDPNELTDSERILRALPYLRDARIYIVPKAETFDVDILVITKDVWNITGGGSVNNYDDFDVTVTDRNFLGQGHQFKNEFPFDSEHSPMLGYIGTYTVNNIYKSFITAEGEFARSDPYDGQAVRLYRNFITPDIKYAGGGEISRSRRIQARVFPDTTIIFDRTLHFQDYWLGRSIELKERGANRTNLQFAISHERSKFLDRPLVTPDTNRAYTNNNRKLLTVGISKRRFERSSLVLGYGRTEDIPIGYLAEVTVGQERNEFYNRNYVGSEFSIAGYWGKNGYFRPSLKSGAFFHDGRTEQGMVSLGIDYFSLLYRLKRTSLRQFFHVEFTRGINRFDNEFININDGNGIRGLSYVFLRGTKKLAVSAETIAFTPIYLIGFRMAIYVYTDLAWINDTHDNLFDNTLYQGYGLGIRFRNENLAINTFQIRLGFYPVTPPDVSAFDYEVSGSQSLGLEDLRVNRPQVLDFR